FCVVAFCLFLGLSPSVTFTLSLHDALPISELGEIDLRVSVRERLSESALQRRERSVAPHAVAVRRAERIDLPALGARVPGVAHLDRKSTRLNSSHQIISYAVFCLKKKKHNQ